MSSGEVTLEREAGGLRRRGRLKSTRSHYIMCALAILMASGAGVWARPENGLAPSKEESPNEAGLPIGRQAPDFRLKDQNFKEISLDDLLKKGPVALVFYRSADWCMFCKLQLVQLQRNLKEVEKTGGQVVGISYDSIEKLKRFADQQKITFPLLSDADSKTIDAFDFRTKEASPEYQGVSRHGAFILDQKGIIRAKLFQLSYNEGPAIEALKKALTEARELPQAKKP